MKINWKRLIKIIIITFFIGNIFTFFVTGDMKDFKMIEKPIDVPTIIFPIVWTILFLLMSISYYIVSNKTNDRSKITLIYSIQLTINAFWTLIFFGLKTYLFSFIWLLLLIISIIIMIITFYKIDKKAGLLQIPYLLWVIFAGYLNLGIYLLNR